MNTEVPYNSTEGPTEPNVTVYTLSDDDLGPTDNIIFIVSSIIIVVGTVLNLWFLVAILRSEKLRSCLRNKIICNIFVLHLVNSILLLPLLNVLLHLKNTGQDYSCHLHSFVAVLWVTQDFIANWLLVMIIVVFIAHVVGFNPETKLTPQVVRFGTWGLLIIPWVVSLLTVLSTLYVYYRDILEVTRDCIYLSVELMSGIRSFDTAVPISLMAVLLMIAAFFKYKGFRLGRSTEPMTAVLIGGSPPTDSLLVYVTAVAVACLCDLLMLILTLDSSLIVDVEYRTMIIVWLTAGLLSDSRVILMVLPWLLLPDVRERIKTWRPWHRPGPGIDMIVTYKKEAD